MTNRARSTAARGTSKIQLKLQGPLQDEEGHILGIVLREAEIQVTVADSLRGDVDGDGSVTISDALRVARAYVGIREQVLNLSAGDVNRNGIMDIIDALVIAQYYVGLITQFPVRQNIKTEKRIDDFVMGTKIIFPLGIVVSELLTNAMKHAFTDRDSGWIQISAVKKGNPGVYHRDCRRCSSGCQDHSVNHF